MPLYEYFCKECNKKTEEVFSYDEYKSSVQCWRCGGEAVRDFSKSSFSLQLFKPYVDEHMLSEPVLIESKSQKKRLLKEHGLAEL